MCRLPRGLPDKIKSIVAEVGGSCPLPASPDRNAQLARLVAKVLNDPGTKEENQADRERFQELIVALERRGIAVLAPSPGGLKHCSQRLFGSFRGGQNGRDRGAGKHIRANRTGSGTRFVQEGLCRGHAIQCCGDAFAPAWPPRQGIPIGFRQIIGPMLCKDLDQELRLGPILD